MATLTFAEFAETFLADLTQPIPRWDETHLPKRRDVFRTCRRVGLQARFAGGEIDVPERSCE